MAEWGAESWGHEGVWSLLMLGIPVVVDHNNHPHPPLPPFIPPPPTRTRQVHRLQADAPRGFYRLPKRVDVGEVNESCDLQGELNPKP